MLRGIDVSEVQGTIPWAKVAAEGISFSIVKGFTGNDGLDPDFQKNVAGAKSAGIIPGVYLFPFPLPPKAGDASRDPIVQARLHFDKTGGFGSNPGELPPLIDAEWPVLPDLGKWDCTVEQIGEWYDVYCPEVERLWGRTPLFYSFPDWVKGMLLAKRPQLARYGLWFAEYPSALESRWPTDTEAPSVPLPWTSWRLWQVGGGKGMKVAGMTVDRDVFNGSLADLQALAGMTNPVQTIAQNAIETAATEIDETGPIEPPPEAA